MISVHAFLKKNSIYLAIGVVLTLMLFTSFFAFRNQQVMRETELQVQESELAIFKSTELLRWLNAIDLGVRGYALGKTEALLNPFNLAIMGNPADIDTLRMIINNQHYSPENFNKYVNAIQNYIAFSKQMIEMARIDSMTQFKQLLAEDRGMQVWLTYKGFSTELVSRQRTLKQQAENNYATALRSNLFLQVILLVLGLPCLYLIYYRIRSQESHRQALLLNLEQNNRKYVFDPGTTVSVEGTDILNASIQNSKDAAGFIKKITTGDFQATWPGMNDKNQHLNSDNLAAILMDMRDQMKKIQEEDRKRLWATEGLTKFTEIIRQHQDDAVTLADQATRFLVRYLEAQQAGTFILQEDAEENQYLELIACYAFDKRKFIEKKIEIGQGIIGQAFLEGTTIILKSVPSGYTHITSGLGEATPTCMLIVPMKYNEKTEGILELAGFVVWQPYQQTFVEQATEYMAAAISTVRSTQKMKLLVEQMQSQTQQLHAQEEEMRQNMEELSATNEEMKRKEGEYIHKLRAVGVEVE